MCRWFRQFRHLLIKESHSCGYVGQIQHHGLNYKNVHLNNHCIIRQKIWRGIVLLIEHYFVLYFFWNESIKGVSMMILLFFFYFFQGWGLGVGLCLNRLYYKINYRSDKVPNIFRHLADENIHKGVTLKNKAQPPTPNPQRPTFWVL